MIGCANVANLLLTHATKRGRQMLVNYALEAARSRLMRQLVTESVLLFLIGGMAGLTILLGTKVFC